MARDEEKELRTYAKDLVSQLAVIIRSAQIHDPTNVAVVSAINRYVMLVNHLVATEPISMELVEEYFFVNGNRVKYTSEYLVNFDFLAKEFKNHGLGSVNFTNIVSEKDIQALLRAFISSSFSEEPFEVLNAALEDVPTIHVARERRKKDEGEIDAKKAVKKTYFNAVSFARGVMNKMRSGEKVSVRKAKRVVQSLVDTLLSQDELLLGMTAIKDYDDYTYHHSVNVSILSIALGQKLGFPKKMLLDLGLSALFHDIGKLEIPTEVLNKPTQFTEDEWKVVKRHPFWGVKSILGIRGLDKSSIRSAIVAFEHHIHHDHTGYPQRKRLTDLDLFSKIVGIVDQYDGMTSARVYSRTPLSPDRALKLMLARSGKQLDPLILKFFINMVGVYPVGALVMLNTRELGLVYGSNSALPTRPGVLVIVNSRGQKIKGVLVDLTEKNEQGQYRRSIVKALDPNKYRINLAAYML